jgi:CMP/dCMP kinase
VTGSATRRLIVAIDGPAGAGKSTTAKALARRLGYLYIDSGAMYRAIAWKAVAQGISLDNPEEIGRLASVSRIDLVDEEGQFKTLIDGEDVSREIRDPQVTRAASVVAAIPAVRRALVARQREIGVDGGVVMEGRDIGTQVFPNAEVKFFLDASVETRSRRRFRQYDSTAPSLNETRAEIDERDSRDRGRSDSPLERSDDAIYIDSSGLNVDEVIDKMLETINARC